MDILKYFKEFVYLFSGICALLAVASGIILVALAPLGLAIWLGDVKGINDVLVFLSVMMCYSIYWVLGRYFNVIKIRDFV